MSFLQKQEGFESTTDVFIPSIEVNEEELLRQLSEFVFNQKRFGLLVGNNPTFSTILGTLHYFEGCVAEVGQCIALDCHDLHDTPLTQHFLTSLEACRDGNGKVFQIILPDMLHHNPQVSSPFLNRALLWQRLSDRLIEDEDAKRPTVLLLKNLDVADANTQHDIARCIRFHDVHHIRRTFLATLQNENMPRLEREVRQLVDARFNY